MSLRPNFPGRGDPLVICRSHPSGAGHRAAHPSLADSQQRQQPCQAHPPFHLAHLDRDHAPEEYGRARASAAVTGSAGRQRARLGLDATVVIIAPPTIAATSAPAWLPRRGIWSITPRLAFLAHPQRAVAGGHEPRPKSWNHISATSAAAPTTPPVTNPATAEWSAAMVASRPAAEPVRTAVTTPIISGGRAEGRPVPLRKPWIASRRDGGTLAR